MGMPWKGAVKHGGKGSVRGSAKSTDWVAFIRVLVGGVETAMGAMVVAEMRFRRRGCR